MVNPMVGDKIYSNRKWYTITKIDGDLVIVDNERGENGAFPIRILKYWKRENGTMVWCI